METPTQQRSSLSIKHHFMAKFDKIKTDVGQIGHLAKQLAQDDPKKIVHSIKVGLAITLVSLIYYFDLLYEGFGVNAMWAVLTVVVVFEFSVGATLGKGVNRVVATLLGGMSAVGAHRLFSLPGETLEPVFLGLSVFLIAGITTFMRFFPKMKARFDYGLLIFILTFSLISVSGYRDDEILDIANNRITTILIGSSAAVIVCVVICPVWAGTDLHKLVATHLETLAIFLQEYGAEYFKTSVDAASNKESCKNVVDGLRKVLDSKNSVDSLLNFARWEPLHGPFKYGHPWKQYQKINELVRYCSCRVEVLHGLLFTQVQAPTETKATFRESCMTMSIESGKALNELSLSIKRMTQPSKAKLHVENAKQAAENLNLMLNSNTCKNVNISNVTPVAAVAALLVDVVACTDEIAKAVQELASLAKFKDVVVMDGRTGREIDRTKLGRQGSSKRSSINNHLIIIDQDEDSSLISSPKLSFSSQDPSSLSMVQQNGE